MSIFGAIIAGLGQVGTQLLAGGQQRRALRKQRRFDYRMMQEMNQYNSPVEQMKRLQAAGLNPNLIYGSGSAAPGTQNQPVTGEYSQIPLADPGATLSAFYDIAARGEDIKYRKKQIETENVNRYLKQSQISNLMSQQQLRDLEHDLLNATFDDRRDTMKYRRLYDESMAVIRKKHAEWVEQGINPQDATWLRMAAVVLKQLGFQFDWDIDQYFQGPQYQHKQYPQ